MQTLTIKTHVSEEKEVQLPIPFYRRRKDEYEFLALLDEKTMVTIYKSSGLTIVRNAEVNEYNKKTIAEAWHSESWTSCTETEFLEKYDSVIESISLHPKLAV